MSRQLASWITLPDSRYGIDYSLEDLKAKKKSIWDGLAGGGGGGGSNGPSRPPLRLIRNTLVGVGGGGNGAFPIANNNSIVPIKKKKTRKNPFEVRLQALAVVVRRANYPDGTALLYIREIFEPGDPEFDFLEADVNVSQLTQDQVDRLKIMIVPQRREDILLGYLDYQETADKFPTQLVNHSSSSSSLSSERVLRSFDGFKRRYAITPDISEKFDLIFGFTFAIKKHSGWMYLHETKRAREKMAAGLARHWRHLLYKNYPEQLGLDREFSYPAVMEFLKSFKEQVEAIDVFGDPPIQFQYESDYAIGSFDADEHGVPYRTTV